MTNTKEHHETTTGQNLGLSAVLAHFDRGKGTAAPGSSSSEERKGPEAHPIRSALLALAFLPLLIAAVRGKEAWTAAVLGIGWLPFVTGITNYYWAIFIAFALLVTRIPLITIGFAAMTVAWGATGLIFPLELSHPGPPSGGESYTAQGLYVWSSVALIAFILWTTTLFALQPSIGKLRQG